MCIWWQQTTWVVLVPITTHIPSFIIVAHTELWIFDFWLLANQNRYANEVLNMRIQWGQTTWVVPPLPTYQIWWKSVIAFSIESEGLPFDVDEKPTSLHTSVHMSIQTALQMKTKWFFQHGWRPTKKKKKSFITVKIISPMTFYLP